MQLCSSKPIQMILSLIVAVDKQSGIGKDNRLLWHLPADLKYFKRITSGHTVIMGRKTFQSIGKPLPGRRNVVLSRDPSFHAEGCDIYDDFFTALKTCRDEPEVFVIGGAEIYRQALQVADRIYITRVNTVAEADTHFPEFSMSIWKLINLEKHKADEKNAFDYTFSLYQRVG